MVATYRVENVVHAPALCFFFDNLGKNFVVKVDGPCTVFGQHVMLLLGRSRPNLRDTGPFAQLKSGRSNTACASICIVGAISTLLIAQYMQLGLGALLAFTAGGFIYIATSDLVPLLRDTAIKVGFRGQFASILTGIVSMQSILWVESALTF